MCLINDRQPILLLYLMRRSDFIMTEICVDGAFG